MRLFLVSFFAFMLACCSISCSKNTVQKVDAENPAMQIQSTPPLPVIVVSLDSTKYFFEGTLGLNSRGEKSLINAEMSFNRTEITGTYRYNTGSRALSLKGVIQPDNTLQLVERDDLGRGGWEKDSNSTVSGRLIGKLDKAKGVITGTWTSKDGKKSFPFSLRATATFKVLHHSTMDVTVDYPVFSAPELSALNDTVARLAKKDYETSVASVDTIRKEYLAMEEMKERAQFISEHSFANVVYAAPNLVSLQWSLDSYGGGAHGNYGCSGITWRIENGIPKHITLADLFQPNSLYKKFISDFLIANLRKQEASMVVDGSVKGFVEDLSKNMLPFTVHSSGLTFYFSPYYVASYAEGAFEVHIPWKALQSLLRADGIVAGFAK